MWSVAADGRFVSLNEVVVEKQRGPGRCTGEPLAGRACVQTAAHGAAWTRSGLLLYIKLVPAVRR